MKKLGLTSLKTVLFFVGWAVCAGLIPVPNTNSQALWRFWAEVIPFLAIVIFTIGFWLIERRAIPLNIVDKPIGNTIFGMITGVLWLGATVGLTALAGALRFDGHNQIAYLWLWLISVLLNAMMQELLVRGYLYQMIKSKYNTIVAAIVTTVIFTFMHGGAFEAGVVPVLNVVGMSLFMTAVLEYRKSLIAPTMVHFAWNALGAVILGLVSLADDYPHLLEPIIAGNDYLSGGIYRLEGSVVTLALNWTLFIIFAMLCKRKKSRDAQPTT